MAIICWVTLPAVVRDEAEVVEHHFCYLVRSDDVERFLEILAPRRVNGLNVK